METLTEPCSPENEPCKNSVASQVRWIYLYSSMNLTIIVSLMFLLFVWCCLPTFALDFCTSDYRHKTARSCWVMLAIGRTVQFSPHEMAHLTERLVTKCQAAWTGASWKTHWSTLVRALTTRQEGVSSSRLMGTYIPAYLPSPCFLLKTFFFCVKRNFYKKRHRFPAISLLFVRKMR